MCSPASFETAYVQRASPTEPVTARLVSATLNACDAEHLARGEVDEPLERVLRRQPGLEHVVGADHVDAHRPHRALEHRVHAGDSPRSGRCASRPSRARRACSASRTSPWTKVRFGCSRRSLAESASRCRLSSATISLRSTSRRASVVPMKPAPPVIRMRLPSSATRPLYPGYPEAHDSSRDSRDRADDHDLAGGHGRAVGALDAAVRAEPAGRCPHVSPACRKLNSLTSPFRPIQKGRALHADLRGPQVARVTGRFRGNRIWAEFRRRDGCEIGRWERLRPLLPRRRQRVAFRRREDGSLRRRRPTPTPRDRAGARAGPSRRRGRPQPGRARARRGGRRGGRRLQRRRRGDRGRPAPRGRRRAHDLRRPRGARRRGRRRGARPARHRHRHRVRDDAEDRDAPRARRAGVPQPRVRGGAERARAATRRSSASGCPPCSSRPTPAASAVSSGSRRPTTSSGTCTSRSASRRPRKRSSRRTSRGSS